MMCPSNHMRWFFWWIITNFNQHILKECYRPFWKMNASIGDGTFSRTLYILKAGSTLLVGLSVSILSWVMSPLQEVTTIRKDSASAETFTCFWTRVMAWSCVPILHALWDSMLDILDRSMSLPKFNISAKCICTMFLVIGKIPVI